MQFKSKITGIWYGVPLSIGEVAPIPERLTEKAKSRSDLFTEVKAEKKSEPEAPKAEETEVAEAETTEEPELKEEAPQPKRRGRPRKVRNDENQS